MGFWRKWFRKSGDLSGSAPRLPSATFCTMPWVNISTETNGKVKPCCIMNSKGYLQGADGSDLKIQKNPIEEIFNAPGLRAIRQKMLRGEKIKECTYCYDVEKANSAATASPSPRQGYNEDFWSNDLAGEVKWSGMNEGDARVLPVSFEPRPGSLCNLKCNSCWSLSSSKVQKEREESLSGKFGPVPDFMREDWERELLEVEASDLAWSENEMYQESFQKMIPGLKRLYFIGGEPTLIKSNLKMLRDLLAAGRPDLKVALTTNLTHISQELLSLLEKFDNLEISCSLDGFEHATEYLRVPSRWTEQIQNLIKLTALPRAKVMITPVVQLSNVISVMDLYNWFSHQESMRKLEIHPFFLEMPDYLRLDIMPLRMRATALSHLQAAMSSNLSERNRKTLALIEEQLRRPEHPNAMELRRQFREYTQYIDGMRGLKFERAFPEMAPLLEGP